MLEEWNRARMAWLDLERKHSLMLRQKSRVKWDVEGDENKAYFHSLFKRRNSRNSLGGVMSNGVWIVSWKNKRSGTRFFWQQVQRGHGGQLETKVCQF